MSSPVAFVLVFVFVYVKFELRKDPTLSVARGRVCAAFYVQKLVNESSEYLVLFRIVSDGFGPFSNGFRLFRNIFGRFRTISDGFGPFSDGFGRFRTVFGSFGIVFRRVPAVLDDSNPN